MPQDKVDMLLKLREFVIKQHANLDGKGSPDISTIKQKAVADVYTSVIKSLEDVLKDDIKFS